MAMIKKTQPDLPPIPSLPQTTVNPQADPQGIAPVRPAVKARPNENGKEGTNWDARNRSIEVQAIMKSTLESPLLAHLAVGKNTVEALGLLETMFNKALELYEQKTSK